MSHKSIVGIKIISKFILFTLIFMLFSASSVYGETYTVVKGDTLYEIGIRYDIPWQEIQELNGIEDVRKLQIGQVLEIPTSKDTDEKTITILGTSDLHGNIWGYSYENSVETSNTGVSRVYSYVKEVRDENVNTVLVDNGDTYQGNIMTDDLFNKNLDKTHPMTTVMNYMAYDAMVLGNHEFNYGIDLVEKIIEESSFPILAANTENVDGNVLGNAYTIIEKDGIRIGIIGLTNPNIPRWDDEKVANINFYPLAETAKHYIDMIKDDVDMIVVSAHAGLVAEFDEEGGSDSAKEIIVQNPEVDLLIVGHMHMTVDQEEGITLIGGPRNNGREVVRADFTFDQDKNIVEKELVIVDMVEYEPCQEIRDLILEEHQSTIDFIAGGGNLSGIEGGGIFGTATEDFQPTNEIKGIPEGKLRDTAVIDLINKVQLEVSGADVSAAALFKDTSDIKAGEINYGTIFDIYKFDNTLYVVEVTGEELINYMEWSASHYNQWVEGDVSISFDPEVPGYLYDMFSGVDYKIDLSKPVGSRIVDVMFNGMPLEDDQIIDLAVNNYRYSSGLKANGLIENSKKWESPLSIRDYLVQYIKDQGEISPTVDNNWEITGINLEHPDRQKLIDMVNNDELEIPYNKSLNIKELIN